jgi:hypothetical protein
VVAVPACVALGDTPPHEVAEQETVHVTPLPAKSYKSVAVSWTVAPACTVAEVGETDTLMGCGGGVLEELPQPQLPKAMSVTKSIPISDARFLGLMTNLSYPICERLRMQRSSNSSISQRLKIPSRTQLSENNLFA